MVSDGWVLFEKTAEETAPGELRQLLRSLKMSTTPPATLTTPTKVKKEEEEEEEENGTGAWHVKDCGNTNLCQAGG